jgi:hypothetical protein
MIVSSQSACDGSALDGSERCVEDAGHEAEDRLEDLEDEAGDDVCHDRPPVGCALPRVCFDLRAMTG